MWNELLLDGFAFFLTMLVVYAVSPLQIKLILVRFLINAISFTLGMPSIFLDELGSFLIRPLERRQVRLEEKLKPKAPTNGQRRP
jgi:hypothetical protein